MNKNYSDMSKFEQWVVCECVGNLKKDSDAFKSPLHITMQINGVEVDAQNVINELDEFYKEQASRIDELVQNKAVSLLHDKISDIENQLYEIGNLATAIIDKHS